MSFIDLMSNVVWTDEDITARTESMVRSVVSDQEQAILMRKVVGASMGQWTLSDAEKSLQSTFSAACAEAHAAGVAARADNDLLRMTMAYEAAVLAGDDVPEPEQSVLDLYLLRASQLADM